MGIAGGVRTDWALAGSCDVSLDCMTYQKVIRHGSALAVVIRVQQARELKLKRGDWVSVVVGSGRDIFVKDNDQVIVIWKARPEKFPSTR